MTNNEMLSSYSHLFLVEFEEESLHLRELFGQQLVLQGKC